MRHDFLVSVHHLLHYAREAVELSRGRLRADLDAAHLMHLVEAVSEAAGRVSEEVRALHPAVPWKEIAELRHSVVHGDGAINLDLVCATVEGRLPSWIAQLETIVQETS